MSKKTLAFQPILFSMLSPTGQVTEFVSQKFMQFIIQARSRYSYKRLLGSDADGQRCFRNRFSHSTYFEEERDINTILTQIY